MNCIVHEALYDRSPNLSISTNGPPALPYFMIRTFYIYIEPSSFAYQIQSSIFPVTRIWNQDGQVLSRAHFHLSLTRGSKVHKFQGHTLGKIVIEIERSAGTAFEVLYRTCYLAGIMILPPLSRDGITNIVNLPICA